MTGAGERRKIIVEVRKHIYFSGMVQGVGFRYRSTYLAQSRHLTGWVKNLYDNRDRKSVVRERV